MTYETGKAVRIPASLGLDTWLFDRFGIIKTAGRHTAVIGLVNDFERDEICVPLTSLREVIED